jgi:8-oxo-dGTP diphosphatase
LRQQFVYVGRTLTKTVSQTDEGTLHWIARDEILDRDLPYVFRNLLEHWLAEGSSGGLWMGTATRSADGEEEESGREPGIIWVSIVDPGLA